MVRSIIAFVIMVVVVVGFAVAAFHFERWFNWKYGYSGKVEPRLDRIEARLDSLEAR